MLLGGENIDLMFKRIPAELMRVQNVKAETEHADELKRRVGLWDGVAFGVLFSSKVFVHEMSASWNCSILLVEKGV